MFLVCIGLLLLAGKGVAQSNDFTVISADKETVKLKIAAGKTLYDVKLVSGTQSFAFGLISNESGDMVMPSGATARPGSQLRHPERTGINFYSFPNGATVKVFSFGAPENFNPTKILVVPKKGQNAIEYKLPSSR